MSSISTSFTYILLALLLFPFYLIGQVETPAKPPSNWSVHAKYGVPLFDTQVAPTYSSFETNLSSRPGVHALIGGGYRYFLNERLSLDVELSYEYGNFSRHEDYSYTRFNGERRSGLRKEQFETHSLLNPLKLSRHYKRVSLSIGLVNTFHLTSKVDIQHTFFVEDQFDSESVRNYSHGDRLILGEEPYIDRMNIDLERRINFQALAGMDIRLNDRIYLNFEIRQYLRKNHLVREYFQYDVANLNYTYYNSFSRTFSIGMRYDLKH